MRVRSIAIPMHMAELPKTSLLNAGQTQMSMFDLHNAHKRNVLKSSRDREDECHKGGDDLENYSAL